jgi:hypothetical protein
MNSDHLTQPTGTAESLAKTPRDHLSLKWGTLKSWKLCSEKGKELLRRYFDIGASMSAMAQDDTPEQKDLICQMIDECDAPTIYLDWDGIDVSKDEAKKYVREYGAKASA